MHDRTMVGEVRGTTTVAKRGVGQLKGGALQHSAAAGSLRVL
jgi:hypothetical protein